MTNHSVLRQRRRRLAGWAVALTSILLFAALGSEAAQAQSYSVIYNFTGGRDGANPTAGVSIDRAGNLYGTATYGGNAGVNCLPNGCGSVYRLTNRNSSWVLTPLYNFAGGTDGANPQIASVLFGQDGTLYSTTYLGGSTCNGNGCGTVFHLQPPASSCSTALCSWNETVLHRFGGLDGAGPLGTLAFDPSGNLVGVTITGGLMDGGTVYQLTHGNWFESVLYHPYGYPGGGITLDHSGNLYGSTFTGGTNLFGSVFQLTQTGSGWVGTDLYDFTNGNDGAYPWAGVTFDDAGNIYGATSAGGSGHGGVVFELSPSNGGWTYTELYSFTGPDNGQTVVGPIGALTLDSVGNLYGTTLADGANGYGAVFKLTRGQNGWTYTSLHDFSNGSDGAYPYSSLVFDSAGNLYGTASAGGATGKGVVFKVAP